MRHCDCLVTVPNWTNSKDAAAEVLLAKDLDKPIFHWPGDINLMDQFAHE